MSKKRSSSEDAEILRTELEKEKVDAVVPKQRGREETWGEKQT